MKNVTITLDEETARWARVQAAQRGISVSRLLAEVLREERLKDAEYNAAMQRFLARETEQLKGADDRYPAREELYDRPVLR